MVDEYLLDTNTLSEPRRPNPDAGARDFFARTPQSKMFVSVVSLAELRYGIQLVSDPTRRADLERWLAKDVRPIFSSRVLPIGENIMLRWRILLDEGRKQGRIFTQPDLLIAATALEYDLTLVTRNVRDFIGLPLRVLNPWHDQP